MENLSAIAADAGAKSIGSLDGVAAAEKKS